MPFARRIVDLHCWKQESVDRTYTMVVHVSIIVAHVMCDVMVDHVTS